MKTSALIAAELLVQHGVKRVVSSPGSRNAPLTEAINRCEGLQVTDVIDERAAAFVALGLARQSRKPVALTCTSGTALLNYAPAVAEAYYQGVPLVVLSADRPMQWIDQEDSQTIRQAGAFNNIVKGSFDIPDFHETDKEMVWYATRSLNEAMLMCSSGKPGPVHINMQYNNPLSGQKVKEPQPRVVRQLNGEDDLNITLAKELAAELADKRVLIVAGFMPPDHKLSNKLRHFAMLPNVAILAEAVANLHLSEPGGIDRRIGMLDHDTLNSLLPDVVITIGGALISRKVKEWLRGAPASMQHWSLSNASVLADCFQHLNLRITCSPVSFFARLGRFLSAYHVRSDYGASWRKVSALAEKANIAFMGGQSWCDIVAHSMIFNTIPEQWNVCCSNGTSIRYAELFCKAGQQQLSCNRGTSGIEGCTSTAVGMALATTQPTLLISGDMSLRHDYGGLALPCVPGNFKIIVMNNGGGDIFRFIPSTATIEGLEEHFTLKNMMQQPLREQAEALGYQYLSANSPESLRKVLKTLGSAHQKTILEVFTSPDVNASALRNFLSPRI